MENIIVELKEIETIQSFLFQPAPTEKFIGEFLKFDRAAIGEKVIFQNLISGDLTFTTEVERIEIVGILIIIRTQDKIYFLELSNSEKVLEFLKNKKGEIKCTEMDW